MKVKVIPKPEGESGVRQVAWCQRVGPRVLGTRLRATLPICTAGVLGASAHQYPCLPEVGAATQRCRRAAWGHLWAEQGLARAGTRRARLCSYPCCHHYEGHSSGSSTHWTGTSRGPVPGAVFSDNYPASQVINPSLQHGGQSPLSQYLWGV